MAVNQTKTPCERVSFGPSLTFLLGLAVLYVSERLLAEGGLALGVRVVALLACVGSFIARSLHARKKHGAGSASLLLAALQAVALAGVGVYFLAAYGSTLPHEDAVAWTRLSAALQTIATILVVTGSAGLSFAEFALTPMRASARIEVARVRAAALSGSVLALAAGYCSLFVFAASRAEKQADYSYFRTSEPGTATRALLSGIGEGVTVTAFFPAVSQVRSEVSGYLKALSLDGAPIDVRFVDRYLEPELARELKVTRDGVLVVTREDASEQLVIGDDLQEARAKLRSLDKEFHERLLKLLRSARTAYVTVGHGELNEPPLLGAQQEGRTARGLRELLQQQNYRVKDLGLEQGLSSRVPDDAGVVLILGPTLPFAASELDALRRYVDEGGKLMLALEPDGWTTPPGSRVVEHASGSPVRQAQSAGLEGSDETAVQPGPLEASGALRGLQALSGLVGLSYGPATIVDSEKFIPRRRNNSDHRNLFSNRFSSHASVSTLSRNSRRAMVVFSGAGELRTPGGAGDGNTFDVALRTFSTAFADLNGNLIHDAEEASSSYSLAVAVQRRGAPRPQGIAPSGAGGGAGELSETLAAGRAFVLSDADVLSDLLMANFPANQMLFIDALRWLGGEESLAGELESEEDVRIEHTRSEDLLWFYALIFGVPALVLGAALMFRRHLLNTRGPIA